MDSNKNRNTDVVTAIPISTPITVTGRYTDINIVDSHIEITDDMKVCKSLQNSVMILALFDIFFSVLYAITNNLFFIPLIFSLLGYFGGKYYNKFYILSYIIYNFFTLLFRIVTLFYIINLDINDDNSYPMFYIFSLLCLLIETWILKIIIKFYSYLKKLSQENIRNLKYKLVKNINDIYW